MRRRSIEVDLLFDPLPHALEGGLCDRFFSIADDVAVELAARLKEGRKLLIKRNESISSLALGLTHYWPVIPVGHSSLHGDQPLLPVNVFPSEANHLTSSHACKDQERKQHGIFSLETGDASIEVNAEKDGNGHYDSNEIKEKFIKEIQRIENLRRA